MATKVAGELYGSITGQLFEIGRQLRQSSGYPFDPEELKRHLQAAIEGKFNETSSDNPKFLKLICEHLILDAVDGTEILADAEDVFSWIDSDFRNWNADEKGAATEEALVGVYEVVEDATYAKMFGSMHSDVRKLCFTQAQIKNFVVKHRNWLRKDGYATLFLFQSYSELFVALVYFDGDGTLDVIVRRFEDGRVWFADDRHRVSLPQLA